MKFLSKSIIFLFVITDILLLGYLILHNHTVALFQPGGFIAQREKNLILTFISLMLLLAIPAVLLTFFTAWKFRSTNTNETYNPDAQNNKFLEIIWWIVPSLIVLTLATITWRETHALDPYQSIRSPHKPVTIQVVSLRWKWLFIYPDEHIATINTIAFPIDTPINFALTADSPMNSFWIPQLAGQIYAMPGMSTQLHLMATKPGEYTGSTAEISGAGFAGMKFIAQATTQKDYTTWVEKVKQSPNSLTTATYNLLYQPSEDTPITFYGTIEKDLYKKIVLQYMRPGNALHQ